MNPAVRWLRIAIPAALLAAAGAGGLHAVRQDRLRAQLLALPVLEGAVSPNLVRLAQREAAPLFAAHCAGCHGTGMQGRPELGAPDLTDAVWLYGTGRIFDIERTIQFGIRDGGKARNVASMPAFGQEGRLTPAEIRDVVQYVLQLGHQPNDPQSAAAGHVVYAGKATCWECHGPDGRGNSDYGAPDLTANVWNDGGGAHGLYTSIYFGRRNVCPGWSGRLQPAQIRALAVAIFAASHPAAAAVRGS